MVSKIAAIALVVIVAAPILIGYGLNIQTESYTDYEEGRYIDVTDYIYNIKADETKLRYTVADPYHFNSKSFSLNEVRVFPTYEDITTTYTPIQMSQTRTSSNNAPTFNADPPFIIPYYISEVIDGGYDANNYYSYVVTYTDNQTYTFDHAKIMYIYFDEDGVGTGEIQTFTPSYGWSVLENVKSIQRVPHGTPPYFLIQRNIFHDGYANLSKGYRLNTDYPISTSGSSPASSTLIQPDGICKSMVLTFNFDSITDSTYYMQIHQAGHVNVMELRKTTVDGVAKWTYQVTGDAEEHELYFNPAIPNNTYQLYLNGKTGGEFRYVGAWSDTLGVAQAFITYPFSYTLTEPFTVEEQLPGLYIKGQTPIMRIDSAMLATYGYKVIRDVTYNPSSFMSNPATKLTNLVEWGSSITFGGVTYTVARDGNITMGTRSVSLNNMVMDSVPVAGGYENRINGIVVSTTPQPSQIVFNGDWQIDIGITSMAAVSKENTHWMAGKFAWDGLDTNFKLVGAFVCLAAFIGLGIYAKQSRAKVWPLLIVCAGAGLMFLVMI